MRLIDADKLRERMYHDAFETDTDMQKWDGGCWIRYKMFENAMDSAPTIDAVEVIRCKDCRWDSECRMLDDDNGFCSDAERREIDGEEDIPKRAALFFQRLYL